MSREVTFSQKFPTYHPLKGRKTYFVEKVCASLIEQKIKISHFKKKVPLSFLQSLCYPNEFKAKHTTIRKGKRFKVGDFIKPMVWAGKPYRKTPEGLWKIQFAPEIELKKVWDFEIQGSSFYINDREYSGETESHFELLETIAENDGLTRHELMDWFQYPKPFSGQIICWCNNVEY